MSSLLQILSTLDIAPRVTSYMRSGVHHQHHLYHGTTEATLVRLLHGWKEFILHPYREREPGREKWHGSSSKAHKSLN